MGRKQNREFWTSGLENTANYLKYYDRLLELSACMFKWDNLPPEIDARFLELTLFTDGHALFFKDEDLGDNGEYATLRSTLGGRFDIYNVPTVRHAYASNGYHVDRTNKDSVVIYNNYLRRGDKTAVEMFSKRLCNIDRIIDVNVNAQKTPIMILCDEDQRLTMENLYMQYEGNFPFIFGNKAINPQENIKAFNTGAMYIADKLYQLKTQIWDEALTYLGITNLNVQKKERLLPGEVQYNQGGTFASRHTKLDMRQKACDQINAMFGLNISVEYREDEVEMAMNVAAQKGGYAGGYLHDGSKDNSGGAE